MPAEPQIQRAARRVGTVLRDKYELTRVLGVGGMAAVYLGVHCNNRNRVAVKVLHAEASGDSDVRARFLREGYVANSIGHRGAVRVLDDDTAEDGSAFLVMELLEGETLHARATRLGGRLPVQEVLALARELCEVLAAAHDKGIVHRDIKPENLFLTVDRVLKVLDFGIARVRDSPGAAATWSGAALGTPAFMPPEQALGRVEAIDARSDVWAVGATLFSLLSGHWVHEAAGGAELVVQAATRPARSLADVAPDVPTEVVKVIDRALCFKSEQRWESARAMAAAIEEAHLAAFGSPLSPAAIGEVPLTPPAESPRIGLGLAETLAADATRPGSSQIPSSPRGETTIQSTDSIVPSAATTRSSGAPPESNTVTEAPPPSAPPSPPPSTEARRPPPATKRSKPEPPPEPSQQRGILLSIGLAAAAGIVIFFTRVLHPGGSEALPPAGESPCLADADCHADGWVCGSNGRCVAASLSTPHTPGCTSNHDCTVARGAPSLCRRDDGACVPIETETCKILASPGDADNDATVWVGGMLPLSGGMAESYGNAERSAVELARRDFAETAGGLPPARPGGPRRPLAVVMCDDATEPVKAAAHLIDDLRLPAIVGFAVSKEVADLATSWFNPKGVLALAANVAPMLRHIPHAPGEPRLVWRTTTAGDQMVAPRLALLSELIEPQLRATPGLLPAGTPLRVAVARIGNSSGLGMADRYASALRFNGKSVSENGESFRQVVVSDSSDPPAMKAEEARAAGELTAFRPHVIFNDSDMALVPGIERAWPKDERFRPVYLGGHPEDPEVRAWVRDHPEIKRRILDTDTLTNTPAVAKFVLRHNEVFPDKITAASSKGATYDAFYLLAYAIVATSEPLSGRAIARSIPRLLPPGQPVDVGPGGIYDAFHALGSGKNIDLHGTTTTLDYDVETGDAGADFTVYCATPEGPADSGLVYRSRTGKLEGTLRCP